MNPNEIGKKLGIGVRVAGRIARQRAQERAQAQSNTSSVPGPQTVYEPVQRGLPTAHEIKARTHKLSRAAGRGVGGFLRPIGRVGGISSRSTSPWTFGARGSATRQGRSTRAF
jgi:hypothetical protein